VSDDDILVSGRAHLGSIASVADLAQFGSGVGGPVSMRDKVVLASTLSIPSTLALVAVCRLWNSRIWSSLSFRFLARLGNNLSAHGLATSSSMACTRVVVAGAFGSSFSLRLMMRAGRSQSIAASSHGIALRGFNLSFASAVSFDDTASI
jgi:hypothetical protein